MATNNAEPRAVCLPMLKGGFGKSTFVSVLGGILGDFRDYNVLVVDLDPAGHLSTGLGYYTRENESATDLADVLLGDAEIDEVVKNPGYGFDVIPSLNLERVTDELSKDSVLASDLKMKQEIVDEYLGDRYDYILLDVPGTRNKLTNNAVVAAPNAILPLMPRPEAINGLRETATRLIAPIRGQLGEFEVLAAVPNDLSSRIDHQTKDRKLLEAMNTQESFASFLLAGQDDIDPQSGKLGDSYDLETVLDNHIPPFARIKADEWEAIDAGEVKPPKPPIRHTGGVGDAYEKRMPLTAHDPENPQLEYFGKVADIIEHGGITQ